MEEKNPIQVADRLFCALELLAEQGAMGLMDISKELGLNKSTAHRILNSLIYMGYAKQEEDSGKYKLTFKIVQLSDKLMRKMDVVSLVRPHLQRLMELTGETVHLVERDGTDAVYIDKVESYSNTIQMVSRIGSRIPLYRSGVGKAIMAEMEPNEAADVWKASDILQVTPHTITDFNTFLKTLEEIRNRGYAFDNEENESGVRCIAVSLPKNGGPARYAFSISAPISRMDDERIKKLGEYILETKNRILSEWSLNGHNG